MPKMKSGSGAKKTLQGDGDGEDPAPPRDAEPQPGAQVSQSVSAPSARSINVAKVDAPRLKKLLGLK